MGLEFDAALGYDFMLFLMSISGWGWGWGSGWGSMGSG